ncbi:hypothetical protein [Streptomyces atroolivaceus]|uniref:hypothetical protein n=1 Tax=Streptomyces atroolivaceus TaxID=66869 RepID=UPI00342060F4
MRRASLAAAVLVTTALGTAPVSASSGPDGWEPSPAPPYDLPAGARCDVPVHTEPVVDEVVQRVLADDLCARIG